MNTGAQEGMALISEELKQYTILCSSNVEPIPLGERQIELLLRRMDKAEDAEQVLFSKLAQHKAYWSNRYGLNDAKPFAMLKELIFKAKWLGELAIIEFVDQPSLKISGCKSIKGLIAKLAMKYNGHIVLQELKYSGEIAIYGQAYPQHDWHHYALAMERQADKKIIRRLIKQYRQGNSTASSIEELSKLIAGYKT